MSKKIKANRVSSRASTEAERACKPLPRSYWILRADGETQHCLWTGPLLNGIPPFEDIRRLLRISQDSLVQIVQVLYKGKVVHMFLDEEAKIKDGPRYFNWKASAIFANAILKRLGLYEGIYNDLLEKPEVCPNIYMKHSLVVVEDAIIWEGELSSNVPEEGPCESVATKLMGEKS